MSERINESGCENWQTKKNEINNEKEKKLETMDEIWHQIETEAKAIQVRAEDKNDQGQLLVDPGGSVSQLSEKQWKIVRTKKFKEWFGDWQQPPVESFKTSHGSIYTYDADGKASRFKTETGEQFKRMDMTVFVNTDDELDFHAASNDEKLNMQIMEQRSDILKRVEDISQIANDENLYLVIIRDRKVINHTKVATRPQKGSIPYEAAYLGNGQKRFHWGNKVTDIQYDKTQLSKVINKDGEPTNIDHHDGTISYVKMKNPLVFDNKYYQNWITLHNMDSDPQKLDKFVAWYKARGYDGFIIDGRPMREGLDESQILRVEN